MKYIGKETSRVDGAAKVTGKAKYAAEFTAPNMAYGFIVSGEIAKGKIAKIDAVAAEKSAGVIKVMTHENTPPFFSEKNPQNPRDESFYALQSDKIYFNRQPLALVVAETFEEARTAARLVKITYAEEKPTTDTLKNLNAAFVPNPDRVSKPRGNPADAYKNSAVKVEAEYTIPIEHHNPMEPHGALAFWDGDKLTIYDKSQNVYSVRGHLAAAFGIPQENVSVISLFVGGAFGSSLRPNYYPSLTAMAARELKRPVRVVYTRRQMFTGHGYRPFTWQKVSLGADKDGKLQAIIHEAVNNTSTTENHSDNTNNWTRQIYACPNVDTPDKIVKTDLSTPAAMRAPGAVSGMFALESAMDELAYKLKIDPLELRLINYAEVNPDNGKPWSSKELKKCYSEGAKIFGWENRKLEPRSMRDGRWLVGYGVASGIWGAFQSPASVKMTLRDDGTARVVSATSDIGPGTYTVMTMIAAEFLGLPTEKVTFELGDTKYPKAPAEGGSATTASVGTAVHDAAQNIKQKLFDMANKDSNSPFKNVAFADVEMANGKMQSKNNNSAAMNFADILKKNGMTEIVEEYQAKPSPERNNYAIAAHGAQFVEVKVDEDLGVIKVTRVVEATATGKIMNPKTSHSQEMGGVVWGIGMALQEATDVDHRYGRIMNPQLADYHIPTNADVHQVDTMFVEEDDKIINPLGVKGMGELGMIGIPAAIANAVFHATGRRVRDLPITLDKLL